MPTQQDLGVAAGELTEKEVLTEVMKATRELYKTVEESAVTVLREISTTSRLGVEIKSVQIDNFILKG